MINEYKIDVSWGSTTIDLSKLWKLESQIDIWSKTFTLILHLSDNLGKLTASYNSVEELTREIKNIYENIN